MAPFTSAKMPTQNLIQTHKQGLGVQSFFTQKKFLVSKAFLKGWQAGVIAQ